MPGASVVRADCKIDLLPINSPTGSLLMRREWNRWKMISTKWNDSQCDAPPTPLQPPAHPVPIRPPCPESSRGRRQENFRKSYRRLFCGPMSTCQTTKRQHVALAACQRQNNARCIFGMQSKILVICTGASPSMTPSHRHKRKSPRVVIDRGRLRLLQSRIRVE
jgi:hypothetical protein